MRNRVIGTRLQHNHSCTQWSNTSFRRMLQLCAVDRDVGGRGFREIARKCSEGVVEIFLRILLETMNLIIMQPLLLPS